MSKRRRHQQDKQHDQVTPENESADFALEASDQSSFEDDIELPPELTLGLGKDADLESLAEPMNELLAELLAQDGDIPAPAIAELSEIAESAGTAEQSGVGEPKVLKIEPSPAAELDDLELATPEPAIFALLEAEPIPEAASTDSQHVSEAGVFELQAEEPEAVPHAAAPSQELLEDFAEHETAAPALIEVIGEPEVEALAPQPPLEHVVSSIDSALEQTRVIPAPAEAAPQTSHHKQFSQLDDYVVFSLSGSDYAVPVRDVAEIGRVPTITRMPNVPDFVRGITNLRGEVVPVLNLPLLLGLQDAPLSARGRVLFLQGHDRIAASGLLVDEVKGIQRIQSQQLEQVTGLVDDKVTSVLRGVHGRGDRLLNVLDLEQLFQLQEFRQLETR